MKNPPDLKPASAQLPRMPKLIGRLEVTTTHGAFLGDTRIRLLEAIDRYGSISQAAKHLPLSYKAAWDALDAMNNLADEPLVVRSSGGKYGGGTVLTAQGRKMVQMYRAVEAENQRLLNRLMTQWDNLEFGDISSLQQLLQRMNLRTSARNQFVCRVKGLRASPVDYEVELELDNTHGLVAHITRDSAEQLGLCLGTEVVALVKASAVVLLTDDSVQTSARNQLWGWVERVTDSAVNAEVVLTLGGGKTVTAIVTHEALAGLALMPGKRACALFKASSVVLLV